MYLYTPHLASAYCKNENLSRLDANLITIPICEGTLNSLIIPSMSPLVK